MEKLRMEAPEKSGASMRGKGIRPSTFGTVHCALRGLALSRALSTTGLFQCALGLPRTLFTDIGRKWRLTLSMALSKPRPLRRTLCLSRPLLANPRGFRGHSFLGRSSGSLERALGLPSASLTYTGRFRRKTLRGHAACAWPTRTRTSGSCLSQRMICSNQAYASDQERDEYPGLHDSSLLGLANISLFKNDTV
jgi:hypothetical protein